MPSFLFCKYVSLPQPAQQFGIKLPLLIHHHMVCPAVGVRFCSHGDTGRGQPAGQPKGDKQAVLRPTLPATHWKRYGGKEVSGIKADLAFLHLDRGIREHRV